LKHDDELDAAAFEPPSDLYHFAKARMESVTDTGFSWLFVGSMSPFRATAEWSGRQCQTRANVPQRRGVANAV
jgi:hypothetical protein